MNKSININFYLTIAVIFFIVGISYAAVEDTNRTDADLQIERGQPNFLIDSVGNIAGLPDKIILMNPKIDNHSVTSDTKSFIVDYINDNSDTMKGVKVRINQWAPAAEMGRLVSNKKISWWWRIFPGIPVTLWSSLTGRILGGDNYNPYTNTISVYSDDPAVLLHEAGHAKDMANKIKGPEADFYAVGRVVPGVTLFQEYTASDEAIEYLKRKKQRKEELKSYRTLYPAYGTYVGSYSGLNYGSVIGAVVGQGAGLWKQHGRRLEIAAYDDIKIGPVSKNLESDPLAGALLRDEREKEKSLCRVLIISGGLR